MRATPFHCLRRTLRFSTYVHLYVPCVCVCVCVRESVRVCLRVSRVTACNPVRGLPVCVCVCECMPTCLV